jgi:hypothetical protein
MRLVVLVVLASFACVSVTRVSIQPGNLEGDGCLQTCKQASDSDDAVVECAARCPGAVVQNADCENPLGADGEPEPVTRCVATMHVRWGRVAKIAGVIAGAALVVTVLLAVAYASTPTH